MTAAVDGRPAIAGEPAITGQDLRLVGIAAAAWVGVLAGSVLGARAGPPAPGDLLAGVGRRHLLAACLLLLAGVAALVAGSRRSVRGPRATALAWSLVLLAALGCGLVSAAAARAGPLTLLARQHATVRVVGEVAAVPSPVRGGFAAPGSVLVRLQVHRLVHVRPAPGRPPVDVVLTGTVSVRAGPGWSALAAGERVVTLLRLTPAPDGRGVQAWGVAVGMPTEVAGPDRVHRLVDGLRDGLVTSCRRLPQPARGLIPAVVDGDTRQVAAGTTSDLRVSGLLHLSAVSGANVAIVLAATTALLGTLRCGRTTTTVAALAVLAGFVLVAESAPSVLRAGLTAALGLLGARRGGPGTGVRLLATSATLLVLTDPGLGLDAGFGLSVCATAAILLGSGRLRTAFGTWLPSPVAAAVAVSVAAQLGAQPVLGLLSGQLSVVGPVANVLAAPAVPPVTLLGLMAAVVSPFSPGAASVAAAGAAPGAWWLAELAHTCAHLPGAAVAWPPGWLGAGLGLVVAAVGMACGPALVGHRLAALPAVGILLGFLAGPVVPRR